MDGEGNDQPPADQPPAEEAPAQDDGQQQI
jgi:hypothetical protein